MTDSLGTDEDGKLFVLLNNTGPGNLEHLQKRLLTYGVEAHLIVDEPAAASGELVTV